MSENRASRYRKALHETLGGPGRMIGQSKSHYDERHPDHVTVFNANVCLDSGKLWWGDLDLTLDEPKVVELAAQIGETVYVLNERHGRFEYETEPLLRKAVYSVTPSGRTRYEPGGLERARDGTLRRCSSTPASPNRTGFPSA